VFGWRMRKHLVELFRSGHGPWTEHITQTEGGAEPLVEEGVYQRLN
jgi:hypothetical protein